MGIMSHWYVYVILGAIALIIFGPQRLPELGASLGKALREFRKGASELTDSFKEEAAKPNASTPTATGTTYTDAAAAPPDATAAEAAAPVAPVGEGTAETANAGAEPVAPASSPEPGSTRA